jgi:hypothetical protein
MRNLFAAAFLAAVVTAWPAAADLAGSMTAHVGAKRPAHCPARLWCACGLSVFLKRQGFAPLPSHRAIDARHYGRRVNGPGRNVIAVLPHHVGVVIGACGKGRVKLVSANYSNRVGIGCYRQSRVIAWRKA